MKGYYFLILRFQLALNWIIDISPRASSREIPFIVQAVITYPSFAFLSLYYSGSFTSRYAYKLCRYSALNYRFYSIHANLRNYTDRSIVAWPLGIAVFAEWRNQRCKNSVRVPRKGVPRRRCYAKKMGGNKNRTIRRGIARRTPALIEMKFMLQY